MNNHDTFKEMEEFFKLKAQMSLKNEQKSEFEGEKSIDSDFEEIVKQAQNPASLALMLYRLTKERETTNRLLKEMIAKFDNAIKEMKQGSNSTSPLTPTQNIEILPEQDQMIMNLVSLKGQVTAKDVQQALSYKGQNAASQRLMKLYKEGHLQKLQAGRKVVYIGKAP